MEKAFDEVNAKADAAYVLGVKAGTELVTHPRRAYDMWNTRYFVLPYYPIWNDEHRGIASFMDRSERIFPPLDAFKGPEGQDKELAWFKTHDYQVRRNLDEFPRSWVVHDARSMPPFLGLSRGSRKLPMEEILFSNDITWHDSTRTVYDPRRYVWLEDNDRPELAKFLPGGYPAPAENVRIVRHESDRVEFEATLERPGVVVLADVYYPGWELTVDGQPAPLYRANRIMRGAGVPSGRHTLVYAYRPASFRIGLIISCFGLAALGLLAVWSALPLGSPAKPDPSLPPHQGAPRP